MKKQLPSLAVLILCPFFFSALFAQPANDKACNAIEVVIDAAPLSVNITGATIDTDEINITPPISPDCANHTWCDVGIQSSAWFTFTAPATGSVNIDLCGSDFDTQLAVYEVGDCNDFSTFNFHDANDDTPGCGANEVNSFLLLECLNPGEQYYVLVDEWSQGMLNGGQIDIVISSSVPSDLPPTVVIETILPTCPGGMDGRLRAIADGVFPLTYLWSTGAITPILENLAGGQSYAVTVTDFCGLTSSVSAFIPEVPEPDDLSIEFVSSSNACDSAFAAVNVIGGVAPYTAQWSTGAMGLATMLPTGTHSVTVSDICGTEPVVGSFTVEGIADAGPNVNISCGPTPLGGNPTGNSVNPIVTTYSTDQTIGSGIACRGGGFIASTSVFRAFNLNDFGITGEYQIDAIQVAINGALAGDNRGFQPIEVRVYLVSSTDLVTAQFIPVDTISLNLPDIPSPMFWNFPIDFLVPANTFFAIEVYTPSSSADGNALDIGANSSPTFLDNPIYISSDDCGIVDPIDLNEIGFMEENIINIVQYAPAAATYTYSWTPIDGLDDPTAANPILDTSLPPGGSLTYTVEVMDQNGCSGTDVVTVVNSSAFPGSLTGGSNSCYQSTLTASIDQSASFDDSFVQYYVLTQGVDGILAALSTDPVFDLSSIPFSTLGISDCGLLTIHSLLLAANADLSGISLGTTTAADVIALLNNGDLCGTLDVAGTAFDVACSALTSTLAVTADALCGQATGSASTSTSGGTPPYSYNWSNGTNNDTLINLLPGVYFLTITDDYGCEFFESISIANTNTLVGGINSISGPLLCFGDTDGAIDIGVNGGQEPYTFEWSNGATTEDLDNLPAGNYSVTITDAQSCEFIIANNIITEPDQIDLTDVVVNEVDGNGMGSIDITPSGGTPPYSYSWSNGSTDEDLTDLSAGDYSVTITDANNCTFFSGFITVDNSVATQEITALKALTIQPNPTAGPLFVEVELEQALDLSISVYTTTGQLLESLEAGRVSSSRHQLDLTAYATGLYLVRVIVDGQVTTRKIVLLK